MIRTYTIYVYIYTDALSGDNFEVKINFSKSVTNNEIINNERTTSYGERETRFETQEFLKEILTKMDCEVVPLEGLTQVSLLHQNVTLVSRPAGFCLAWPPLFHQSLHQHIRLTHSDNLLPAHATALARFYAILAVRMAAVRGHWLTQDSLAKGTRERRLYLFSETRGRDRGPGQFVQQSVRQMF